MATKVLLLFSLGLLAHASRVGTAANPIRKVVNMLQAMQKKVEAEGDKEKDMFEKFMCYCKNSGGDLQKGISAAEAKIPTVESNIEASGSKHVQLKADIKSHQEDRAEAKSAMAEATELRKKSAGEYAKQNNDLSTNVAATGKAIAALGKGVGGAFLQTGSAQIVRQFAIASQDLSEVDREQVLSFLSGSATYAPLSGEIIGILKQMKEEMEKDLAAAQDEEATGVKSYKELMAAKVKEVNALTAAIEKKTVRSGELAVEIVQMKEDLSDTATALEEDKKFLDDMEKNCATKSAEWDEIRKTRADELVALADTIKVLNDDDALDLFKKTLPSASASFMQITVTNTMLKQRALEAIRKIQKSTHHPGVDFIALALRGKKVGFDKVIGMIDEMVVILKKEQVDDDDKKEYCNTEFDATDDKKKGLERKVEDSEQAIASAKEASSQLSEEIKALTDGIVALDKSVADATENRKEENSDYKSLFASNSAAKEVLGFAKNRLNKFYNPKLYKPPPKRTLSREDQITVNMGGQLESTQAPGGIAGTGIALIQTSRNDGAPPPPPEAVGAYKKKSGDSNGVMAMIDILVADLDKELTESEVNEKDSQADYEKAMEDSAAKRVTMAKSLATKENNKADANSDLDAHSGELRSTTKELAATNELIAGLHGECDWLLQNFDARKGARAAEVDSLHKAKAVLSGADYSLIQTKRTLRGYA